MNKLVKEIQNGRMLKQNGSWMYCNACNKTIGYLCYSSYLDFQFDFECNCGKHGSFRLYYDDGHKPATSDQALVAVKKRLCCPEDRSPLFTIVEKNVERVSYRVTCRQCLKTFESLYVSVASGK